MTSPLNSKRPRRSLTRGFAVAVAAALAAGPAAAGDDANSAEAECVEEISTTVASSASSMPADETGAVPKCGLHADEQHSAEQTEDGDVDDEKDVVSDEKVDEVKEMAAAEPDDGRTAPKESWMTESTEKQQKESKDGS
jgi:hypothetical protein